MGYPQSKTEPMNNSSGPLLLPAPPNSRALKKHEVNKVEKSSPLGYKTKKLFGFVLREKLVLIKVDLG